MQPTADDFIPTIMMLFVSAVFFKWLLWFKGAEAGEIAKKVLDEFMEAVVGRRWNPKSLNALGMLLILAVALTLAKIVNGVMFPGMDAKATMVLAAVLILALIISVLGFIACVWIVTNLERK